MRIEEIIGRLRPRRKVHGIAAALLPFEEDGRIAVEAFQKHLQATHEAGLTNAVNTDTGYVNHLTDAEKLQVLQWTREALGSGVPFIAGAYIEGDNGDLVSLYRRQMDQIVTYGGTPIIFQTARLHGKALSEKANVYREACKGYTEVLGFELGRMFAPSGEIFDEETVRKVIRLIDLNEYKRRQAAPGLKVTSKAFGMGRRIPIAQRYWDKPAAEMAEA